MEKLIAFSMIVLLFSCVQAMEEQRTSPQKLDVPSHNQHDKSSWDFNFFSDQISIIQKQNEKLINFHLQQDSSLEDINKTIDNINSIQKHYHLLLTTNPALEHLCRNALAENFYLLALLYKKNRKNEHTQSCIQSGLSFSRVGDPVHIKLENLKKQSNQISAQLPSLVQEKSTPHFSNKRPVESPISSSNLTHPSKKQRTAHLSKKQLVQEIVNFRKKYTVHIETGYSFVIIAQNMLTFYSSILNKIPDNLIGAVAFDYYTVFNHLINDSEINLAQKIAEQIIAIVKKNKYLNDIIPTLHQIKESQEHCKKIYEILEALKIEIQKNNILPVYETFRKKLSDIPTIIQHSYIDKSNKQSLKKNLAEFHLNLAQKLIEISHYQEALIIIRIAKQYYPLEELSEQFEQLKIQAELAQEAVYQNNPL